MQPLPRTDFWFPAWCAVSTVESDKIWIRVGKSHIRGKALSNKDDFVRKETQTWDLWLMMKNYLSFRHNPW